MARLIALAVVVGSLSCMFENGFPGQVCTLIGCVSGAQLDAFETTDASALMGATVRVCHNNACSEVAVPDLPPAEQGRTAIMVGDVYAEMTLWNQSARYEVVIHVRDPNAQQFADGDVYTAEVRVGAGVISARAWTAEYDVFEPNGPDCGPTCFRARLTPR